MELNINEQDEEEFFTQEVLSILMRDSGFTWRPSVNYALLPSHLQWISEFIAPVVNGAKKFVMHNGHILKPANDYFIEKLKETPEEERCKFVLKSLIKEVPNILNHQEQEGRTFVFIGFVMEICCYFVITNQLQLITIAASGLQIVLTKLPGGFNSTINRLAFLMNSIDIESI